MYIINILFSLIHYITCFTLMTTILVTSNIRLLVFCLLALMWTKVLYKSYGDRCALTLAEENPKYPTVVELFKEALIPNHKLSNSGGELLTINLGIIMTMNKIMFFLCYPYIKKVAKYYFKVKI